MSVSFDSAWHIFEFRTWTKIVEHARKTLGDKAHESYVEIMGAKFPLYLGQKKCKIKLPLAKEK